MNELDISILVVDDQKVNLVILGKMLEMLGYVCDTARDGAEAVEAAARKAYDLILMDVRMPVMDGLAAAAAILLQADEGKRPFIVAVTAEELFEETAVFRESGMRDALPKPITMKGVKALLQRYESGAVARE